MVGPKDVGLGRLKVRFKGLGVLRTVAEDEVKVEVTKDQFACLMLVRVRAAEVFLAEGIAERVWNWMSVYDQNL